MALSNNKKVRELYEAGEYTAEDGTLWVRGMDGWFDRQPGYFIVWRHHDFVAYIEEKFPGDADPVKEWEIWSEGYQASGDSGTAVYHDTIEAVSFDEACQKYADSDPMVKSQMKRHGPGHWTYWACQMFDNEADARKTYG